MVAAKIPQVLTFGKKKKAIAVVCCSQGRGMIRCNGSPLHLMKPEGLRLKLLEPVLLVGKAMFRNVDIRVRCRGGGQTSQIYAARQAIAKSLVAYYQKYVDEASKLELKDIFINYDKSLLVADPRRTEPKKFGGHGARARRTKSYR
eukprot:NODE_6194_length_561_cov_517.914747_g6029_i0.p2 GENE.NODE_6194_length_561_cov_517.914747_g6029_i0~~NODE_6194_length_561_cov_517.914747_g6029_i0.p2  ORF type:complete len:146 (+),score=20.03 NODE_6194_length_561_cov_517.914747_g6029_i0:79-516(+)